MLTRVALLLVALATAGCIHKSKPVAPPFVIKFDGVTNTPTADADTILLPAWVDDDVKVCADNFPRADRQCITVGELRIFLFGRRQADQ